MTDRPNRFVAGFIGSPAMNFVDGVVGENGRAVTLSMPGSPVVRVATQAVPGRAVTVGLRPEHLVVGPPDADGAIRTRIGAVEPTGSTTYLFTEGAPRVAGHDRGDGTPPLGRRDRPDHCAPARAIFSTPPRAGRPWRHEHRRATSSSSVPGHRGAVAALELPARRDERDRSGAGRLGAGRSLRRGAPRMGADATPTLAPQPERPQSARGLSDRHGRIRCESADVCRGGGGAALIYGAHWVRFMPIRFPGPHAGRGVARDWPFFLRRSGTLL